MAAVSLAEPGSEFGPCEEPCKHVDCQEARVVAATICKLCQEPIGYSRAFYEDRQYGLVHAYCLEKKVLSK